VSRVSQMLSFDPRLQTKWGLRSLPLGWAKETHFGLWEIYPLGCPTVIFVYFLNCEILSINIPPNPTKMKYTIFHIFKKGTHFFVKK